MIDVLVWSEVFVPDIGQQEAVLYVKLRRAPAVIRLLQHWPVEFTRDVWACAVIIIQKRGLPEYKTGTDGFIRSLRLCAFCHLRYWTAPQFLFLQIFELRRCLLFKLLQLSVFLCTYWQRVKETAVFFSVFRRFIDQRINGFIEKVLCSIIVN